jgi:predicted component of type VI protein secretion system
VGKREALIEKTEDGYYLTPEKSKTKVKLNHQPLKEKTRLKEFDVIELGSTMIQFHY